MVKASAINESTGLVELGDEVGGDDGSETEQTHGDVERRRRCASDLNWCISSFISSVCVAQIDRISVTVESNFCWISTSRRCMGSNLPDVDVKLGPPCSTFEVSLTMQFFLTLTDGSTFGRLGKSFSFCLAHSFS
jgi:hypothetical protein